MFRGDFADSCTENSAGVDGGQESSVRNLRASTSIGISEIIISENILKTSMQGNIS
jgi:hypothetical protein